MQGIEAAEFAVRRIGRKPGVRGAIFRSVCGRLYGNFEIVLVGGMV